MVHLTQEKEMSMEDNISAPVRVAVRIRPLLPQERPNGIICAHAIQQESPQLDQVFLGNAVHEFDHAFNPDVSQNQVFQTAVAPLMDQLLEGFDTSVIMFGQSNTGKSHTLFGPGVHLVYSEAEYGIIPRATRHIFGKLMKARNRNFCIKITFLEVCNDSVRDLLAINQFQQEVVLDENAEGYPVIIGAQEVECENVSEVFNCLHAGINAGQISWNLDGPSVSHYIFQIVVEQKWVTPEGLEEYRLSLATFADLGSTISQGIRRDSFSMDCGLIALSNVVTSLTQRGTKEQCYQQSTLTRLLKESFGGRCYSLVVCCISPSWMNLDESMMTLRFAERVKNIQNTPRVSALLRVVEEQATSKADDQPEGITNGDTFGLEFAASQWHKLVHNAEGLFKTLVNNKTLSEQEKDQIEEWLCLKEECEEVVASDEEEVGTKEKENRLEKIDEVTENEDKTDSSKDGDSPPKPIKVCEDENSKCASETESEEEEEEELGEESEADNQRPDFHERLEEHMNKLRENMEEAVAVHEDLLQVPVTEETDSQTRETSAYSVRPCMPKGGRRRSVHPEIDLPLMMIAQQNVCAQSSPPLVQEEPADEEATLAQQAQEQSPPKTYLQHLDPQQQLKILSAANEAKQNQIKEVLIEIERGYKELNELETTIQMKEQLIGEMMKNNDTRNNAKQKFHQKRTKLEESYYKTKACIAQAENALANSPDEKAKLKKKLDAYNKKAAKQIKQIKDMEVMKQIAGESAKTILEYENSLQSSKRQREKLKQKLQRAEARKISLEQELLEDQNKIKELEDKFQEQEFERGRSSASASESERLQWIQVEEERLTKLRESSQRFQEQLIQQQSILEKREAFLKEKICLEKQRNKSLMEVSARISHLDQVLKEKSTDLEHMKNSHEKEALRLEIHNLRSTRDCLIEQRCTLETRKKDKTLSTVEERKLLECEEAIEAIDAAIEYKNELICGRKGGLDSDNAAREKGEQMLMQRLSNLQPDEMRMLLYKYFQKVIDVTGNGRKLEALLTERERTIDSQAWRIQALTSTIHQQRLQYEQQIVQLQWQHQEKLHHMLRLFAEDSSTGAVSSGNEVPLRHSDGRSEIRADIRVESRDPHIDSRDTRTDELTETKTEERADCRSKSQIFCHRIFGTGVQLRGRNSRSRNRSTTPTPGGIPKKNLKALQHSKKVCDVEITKEKTKLVIEKKKPTFLNDPTQ